MIFNSVKYIEREVVREEVGKLECYYFWSREKGVFKKGFEGVLYVIEILRMIIRKIIY